MSIYQPTYGHGESPRLGEFHPTYVDVSENWAYGQGQSTTQYNIVVKRNDMLYRTLSMLNTVLSIFGVMMVIATFLGVCYGLVMMTQVLETVQIIQNQQNS